jgi:hypothetical protein
MGMNGDGRRSDGGRMHVEWKLKGHWMQVRRTQVKWTSDESWTNVERKLDEHRTKVEWKLDGMAKRWNDKTMKQ